MEAARAAEAGSCHHPTKGGVGGRKIIVVYCGGGGYDFVKQSTVIGGPERLCERFMHGESAFLAVPKESCSSAVLKDRRIHIHVACCDGGNNIAES